MDTSGIGKNPSNDPDPSGVPDNSDQPPLRVENGIESRSDIISNGTRDSTKSKVVHKDESRNDGLNEELTESDPTVVSKGEIKQAWTDDSARQTDLKAQSNHEPGENMIGTLLSGLEVVSNKKAEEERIRELLTYMEDKKRMQETDSRIIKGRF